MTRSFVVLGGTGDLTGRLLLLSLARLYDSGVLPDGSGLLAVAREDWDDDAYRGWARDRSGPVLSMTEEQLAAVRLYTSTEVVQMLRLETTWLKNWITDDRVPPIRAGAERGVRFTAEHILEIGSMLPELLGGHRGGSTAGCARARDAVLGQPTLGATVQQQPGADHRGASAEAPAVVDIAVSSQLRAHRPRPRSS